MAGAPIQTVKFVGHDAAGLPVKRKQVNQACLPCRKRKKRCHHVPQNAPTVPADRTSDQAGARAEDGPSRSARPRGETSIPDRDTSDAAAQLLRFFHHASDKASAGNSPDQDQRQQQPRQTSPVPPFLGDLNPEGILCEATLAPAPTPKTPQTDEQPDHQILGFLPPASPQSSRPPAVEDQGAVSLGSPKLMEEIPGPFFSVPREDGTRCTIHVQDTAKFAALAQTLVSRGLADKVMPSETEWRAMRDIYLAKIHPIFPIFDESTLVDLPEDPGLRELTQACVCLAAATDPEACSLLTFKTHMEGPSKPRTTVSFDEYSREMATFINRRLTELQEAQRIPLTHQIQVMALTCFYWQPADPADRFKPQSLFYELVAIVHTHGIHLDVLQRACAKDSHNAGGSASRLFKCLYALDRLNGAMSARPLMFHNYDVIRVPHPEAHDPPIFKLFLALIALLDQVIELYRPRPKVSYVEIPVFERMAIEAGAQCEPESLLATLEVLYHAICVLSVRMPRYRFRTAPECDTLPGPRTQHLPPSSVNARRSHSADRILDIIQSYSLCPMPFVPYALALSLGVAYRKWRFSRLPMFRTRGGADFKRVLPALQEMGSIWSTARINGQLGQAVMLKLDRNEVLNRKDLKKTTEAAKGKRGQATGSHEGGAQVAPSEGAFNDTANQNHAQLPAEAGPSRATSPTIINRTTTPPDAPSSPRVLPDSVHLHDLQRTDKTSSLSPPSLRGSLPSPATSSLTELPQPPTLAWTSSLATDNSIVPNNNKSSSGPGPGLNTCDPRLNPTNQQSTSTLNHEYCPQADDVIPLPCDLVSQPNPSSGVPPLGGFLESNLDDFLVNDDDALFRSWDPRFAQSVDFSFSSILDPGNPFAWPEYCNYTS
ncbi:hypothetical protein C8A03DRAFT_37163 [Achaetomium macrosporum]|uniref:Transcription factor domain-containing protein n=1 Tax=Achaetomium macrosporum TaxID=79813 RepID=A0AAN7C5X4_9PEZI|nr:hypothetical protein C8A03DRAFT_37163 [Achaetomium macrosporum]